MSRCRLRTRGSFASSASEKGKQGSPRLGERVAKGYLLRGKGSSISVRREKRMPKNEKPPIDDGLTQSERFIKAAQELGTDDDPERFKERVRKLAKAKPDASTEKE